MVVARAADRGRSKRPTPAARAASAPRRDPVRRVRGAVDWDAKLRPALEPRVVEDRRRGGTLLLPTPLLVGEAIAAIPRGRAVTFGELRATLARRFHADRTCPLLTGIFASILAGAVVEDLENDRQPRWPVWRLVRDDGTLHPKWPLGALYRASMLRFEGARVTWRDGLWAAIDTHHC